MISLVVLLNGLLKGRDEAKTLKHEIEPAGMNLGRDCNSNYEKLKKYHIFFVKTLPLFFKNVLFGMPTHPP